MKKYMKKIVMTMAVCAMGVTAFAAEPAFDSPKEEAAFWIQEKAVEAWNVATIPERIGGECYSRPLYAAPAFDTAEQEAMHWKKEKAKQAWEIATIPEMIGGEGYSRPLYAVPAFDTAEQEASYWQKQAAKADWEEAHANRLTVTP